jgi:prolyl-tRNA editing enzyme YbaK/EbsC (Cys-tRNA(Pro) deacylase)
VSGVPPLGHAVALQALMDRRLFEQSLVYAAAGTRHSVFAVEPEHLRKLTGARVLDLVEDSE